MWHCFKSLELAYRDAYFNQLNDRYKGKWTEFQNLSKWARTKLIETGAGLIIDPIAKPAAPTTAFETSDQVGGTIYYLVTLLNSASEESSPSTLAEILIPDGNTLSVTASYSPDNVTGWNVYAGPTPEMTLQNRTPVPLTVPWKCVMPLRFDGQPPRTGQSANVIRDLPRRWMRG